MILPTGLHLSPYDARTVSDALAEEIAAFSNEQLQERWPEAPLLSPVQIAEHLRNLPDFVDVPAWVVRDETRIIAEANVALVSLDQNRHLAHVQLDVLASARHQGLASALLQEVTDRAAADNRTLLLFSTDSRVPAGEAVMRRWGAEPGLASHTYQLDLEALDHSLLERWVTRGQERAAGYDIEVWEGGIPEADFTSFLSLLRVMNDQPTGDLQVEAQELTAEQLRTSEAYFLNAGRSRIRAVVRRQADRRLLGFTELIWHPSRPVSVSQGATGVSPEARGLGLGRWLKALALQQLVRLNAEGRYVRTQNADVNEAMRQINEELGYALYSATTHWQLEVSQAQAYLQQRRTDAPPAD